MARFARLVDGRIDEMPAHVCEGPSRVPRSANRTAEVAKAQVKVVIAT